MCFLRCITIRNLCFIGLQTHLDLKCDFRIFHTFSVNNYLPKVCKYGFNKICNLNSSPQYTTLQNINILCNFQLRNTACMCQLEEIFLKKKAAKFWLYITLYILDCCWWIHVMTWQNTYSRKSFCFVCDEFFSSSSCIIFQTHNQSLYIHFSIIKQDIIPILITQSGNNGFAVAKYDQ